MIGRPSTPAATSRLTFVTLLAEHPTKILLNLTGITSRR
jgi:hypothetical protein